MKLLKLTILATLLAGCNNLTTSTYSPEAATKVAEKRKRELHCDFKVPDDYSVVYDSLTKRYFIETYTGMGNLYLKDYGSLGVNLALLEDAVGDTSLCEEMEILYRYLEPARVQARLKKITTPTH